MDKSKFKINDKEPTYLNEKYCIFRMGTGIPLVYEFREDPFGNPYWKKKLILWPMKTY
jgi:hypothetical protein